MGSGDFFTTETTESTEAEPFIFLAYTLCTLCALWWTFTAELVNDFTYDNHRMTIPDILRHALTNKEGFSYRQAHVINFCLIGNYIICAHRFHRKPSRCKP